MLRRMTTVRTCLALAAILITPLAGEARTATKPKPAAAPAESLARKAATSAPAPAPAPPVIRHEPTIDESLSLKSVSHPAISPDGKLVAYGVQETDWKENAYVRHIFIADLQSGRSFQLTRGKKSSGEHRWSPDGRWLAFTTEREATAIVPPDAEEPATQIKPDATPDTPPAGKSGTTAEKPADKAQKSDAKPVPVQIWIISPAGGEAWQLTKHGASIDSFRWSPDGKRIAFVAAVPESKATKARKEKYGDYEVFEQDYEQNQLWIVDVAAAEANELPQEAKQITRDAALNVGDFDWSPDGTRIAFDASRDPLLSHTGGSDIFLADLAHGNRVQKIVALDGPDSSPLFSPSGDELAFQTSLAAQYFFYSNQHIATVKIADVLARPASKPADVRDVTSHFDEDADLVAWAPAGIYFHALQKTASHLYYVDPASGVVGRLTTGDDYVLGETSFSRDYREIALTAQDSQHLSEVYAGAVAGPLATHKITDMSAQLANLTLGSSEVVTWKSKDDAVIEGILHKPANFDASKKYPLLVVIHGGPTGVSRAVPAAGGRYYPIERFLAKGALVLEPNYRGSAGYGQAFRALNVRNLGVGDMWDVMSGVDSLIARGIVDPARLGSMGWSEGGYISAFLTTNTDRFKAISVGAGISDWTTYYTNTDITGFTPQYLKATPWEDPQIYATTSPMTNIRNAKTPTLIQHGERDKRVPPPNAFALYRGLTDVGVPVKLILYAGYGHGITKPKSNRAVLQHNLDWFSHYIFGEPIAKDSPLNGTAAH
jgi:dipeptidyl aminopeptidase/acylaminoacyl peptidase